jgi:hypothetical protein
MRRNIFALFLLLNSNLSFAQESAEETAKAAPIERAG